MAFLFLRFLSNGRRQRRAKKRPQQKYVFTRKKILGRICVPTKWIIPNGTFSHSYYPFNFPLVNQQRVEA